MNKVIKIDDSNKIYSLSFKSVTAIVFASISAFTIGLALNFSLEDKINSIVTSSIKQNKNCSMNFKDMKISYLLPSLTFTNFSISNRCLGSTQALNLSRIDTSVSLPSFSPLGPTLKTTINDPSSEIEILSVLGIFNHHFKLTSHKLSSKTFAPLLNDFKISGMFSLNSDISTNLKSVQAMTLQLKSMNFSIPAQAIQGFEVPNLVIGPLSIKLEMDQENELKILEFIVGNELSPIRANIKGSLTIVPANIKKSKVDLLATVKFSASFLESFSILNLFLDANKQDEDGFYKLKITGTLNKLDKPEFLN